jgi:hypothetical protein
MLQVSVQNGVTKVKHTKAIPLSLIVIQDDGDPIDPFEYLCQTRAGFICLIHFFNEVLITIWLPSIKAVFLQRSILESFQVSMIRRTIHVQMYLESFVQFTKRMSCLGKTS